MVGARIVAAGHSLPENVVTNEAFLDKTQSDLIDVKVGFTDPEKIFGVTGIRERRIASEEDTLDSMVSNAFLNTGYDAQKLGGIIVATARNKFPSTATAVHERIGSPKECTTFDVGNACSGFMSALKSAYGLVKLQQKPVLVAGVERLTDMNDYNKKNCTLFGDGCGVVVVEPYDNESSESPKGILAGASDTLSGNDRNLIYLNEEGFIDMPDGGTVLKRAVRGMYDVAKSAMGKADITCDDVGVFLPHQANARIIQGIESKLRKEGYQGIVINNIEKYGNMSAATQPVAYSMNRQSGIIKPDSLVVWMSMGSGLSFEALVERV